MAPREQERIVVLDGFTLNPGDLDWAPVHALGEVVIHDRTDPADTLARCRDAPLVLTDKTELPAEIIEQLPALRYIGVLATGYNIVDVAAARRCGVVVTNVPAYSTDSVAQVVFALVLNFTHHVSEHALGVREGKWCRCDDFAYWDFPLIELRGKTMGIVGFGQIGRAVAKLAAAFGMDVIVTSRTPDPTATNVRWGSLEEVLRDSDIVSLHCPLTEQTERMIDGGRLAMMKPSALLINTGRGGLLDEPAVADALNAGRLAGLGADVLSTEPPSEDNPLLAAANCYITPHLAWASCEARRRLMDEVVENIRAFRRGEARNVVHR